MPRRLTILALLLTLRPAIVAADDAGVEFFEKKVRPILVARCFECHSGKIDKPKGGLRLDSLAAATKGGETGPAIVPGKPKESLLVDAINYGELYKMPPKTRLPAEEVAALTKWIEMGAPWATEIAVGASTAPKGEFNLAKRKAEHWCWQPLSNPEVPQIRNQQSENRNPIDAFILARLESKGLSSAPQADPRTLIRRVCFDLIGLPPSVKEVDEFLAAYSPSGEERATERQKDRERKAFEAVVDKLLDSPQFGERWCRHWLDLVRYAESRGHEFDYNIPNAFEYRDYVIRALNADVPYDQFVVEHVAGDLLEKPRLHPQEDWNESIIGTGFWFLGEWCHSPVDIRKDECDRIDNQIDVFSKTFLGLTVACARCHDHKFDAISQADYYALAGYLQSSSYRLTRFETWKLDRKLAAEVAAIDAKHAARLSAQMARQLRPRIDELAARLAASDDALKSKLTVADTNLRGARVIVDYGKLQPGQWQTDGFVYGLGPILAGQFVQGDLAGLPSFVAEFSGARNVGTFTESELAAGSDGDQGRLGGWLRAGRALKTPTWTLESGQVHYLIEGAGHVYAAVDSHAMINGPLHGELAKDAGNSGDLPLRWITHDLSRYTGQRVHLEFSPKESGEDFSILMVVEGPERPSAPALQPNFYLARALEAASGLPREKSVDPFRTIFSETIDQLAANELAKDKHAKDRAKIANWLISEGQFNVSPTREMIAIGEEYVRATLDLPERGRIQARVCLAMWDGTAVDENLLIRGNHKTIGPVVPRRLLEAIPCGAGSQPANSVNGSGRLELARQLVDPANPFTSRVMVNRIWQHLFGRGIVPSVDNFGVLGQQPTHPELLDFLAQQFIRDGWSVKRLIRSIVLSDTYRQSSGAGLQPAIQGAETADPQNVLFHRQNLRRLEGESIRDAILAISGRLDPTQFGPSVPVHLTPFMQGRGRPGTSGPLDGAGRRSIYIAVRRNFLSPMMLAFDTPIPLGTVGRRNVSNVPAQALILMNDPFVAEQSERWAKKVLADKVVSPEVRVAQMYEEAFARKPTAEESSAALAFLASQAREYGLSGAGDNERVWADLGHVIFNVKEFVLLQ